MLLAIRNLLNSTPLKSTSRPSTPGGPGTEKAIHNSGSEEAMTDETREFVLGEEVEFVHKDTTYVYSFRSRESRITFKRIWNPPEAEVDVYPNASLVAVNIAILVLYKAATWKSGVPMPQFIPALLSKLLAGFTLIDELEKNMKGVIRTFSTFGGGTEEGEDAIAKIDALMKFLEPYTPWATSASRESSHNRSVERSTVLSTSANSSSHSQSIHDVLELPATSEALSGLKKTFQLLYHDAAKSSPTETSAQTPRRTLTLKVPKDDLKQALQQASKQSMRQQEYIPQHARKTASKIWPPAATKGTTPSTPPTSKSQLKISKAFGQPFRPLTPTSQPRPATSTALVTPTPATASSLSKPATQQSRPRLTPSSSPSNSGNHLSSTDSTSKRKRKQPLSDPFIFDPDEDDDVRLIDTAKKRRQADQTGASDQSDERDEDMSSGTSIPSPVSSKGDSSTSQHISRDPSTDAENHSLEAPDAIKSEMIQKLAKLDSLVGEEKRRTDDERMKILTVCLEKHAKWIPVLQNKQIRLEQEFGKKEKQHTHELDTVNTTLQKLQQEKSELEKSFTSLQAKSKMAMLRGETYLKSLKELGSENQKLQTQLDSLRKEQNDLINQNKQLKEEVPRLKSDLNQMQLRIQEKDGRIKNLTIDLAKAKENERLAKEDVLKSTDENSKLVLNLTVTRDDLLQANIRASQATKSKEATEEMNKVWQDVLESMGNKMMKFAEISRKARTAEELKQLLGNEERPQQ